jgi:hypothetical protein
LENCVAGGFASAILAEHLKRLTAGSPVRLTANFQPHFVSRLDPDEN